LSLKLSDTQVFQDNDDEMIRELQEMKSSGKVCKAHRLVYHSTLGLRVIKKKRKLRQGRELFFFITLNPRVG